MRREMEYHWWCLDCDEVGGGDKFDSQANSHTKRTGHSTMTSLRPKQE